MASDSERQAARRRALRASGGAVRQFALTALANETIGRLRLSLRLQTDVEVIEHILEEARTRRGL